MSEFINTVDVLGDDVVCDRIITRSLTEYSDSYIKSIGEYALYSCTSLTKVDFQKVTSVGLFAFYGCSALKTVSLPMAELIDNYGFYNNRKLESIYIPLVAEIGKNAFYGCSALNTINVPSTTLIGERAFYNDTALTTIVLNVPTMCTLENVSAFEGTPIASGTGYIYVPSALVSAYKQGTNWSAFASQIRAIEDYPDITGG